MTLLIYEQDTIEELGDAVRSVTGTENPMTVDEMTEALEQLAQEDNSIYETITIMQDVGTTLDMYNLLTSFITEDASIVQFTNNSWNGYPTSETPDSTMLSFLWFAPSYWQGTATKGLLWRWRANAYDALWNIATGYSAVLKAGDTITKVVIK